MEALLDTFATRRELVNTPVTFMSFISWLLTLAYFEIFFFWLDWCLDLKLKPVRAITSRWLLIAYILNEYI